MKGDRNLGGAWKELGAADCRADLMGNVKHSQRRESLGDSSRGKKTRQEQRKKTGLGRGKERERERKFLGTALIIALT